jgi:EAL domain-containing protein (putative c-di-GMP-specific phosphodiesterase class I)
VVEEACRDAAKWSHARPDARPLMLGINLSTLQLSNSRFPEMVAEAIRTSGLSPSQINLEIAETLLMEDAEAGRRVLRQLKAIGVGLVVDDFGTGQSSLTHLASLPIDAVKIDRSCVAEIGTGSPGSRVATTVIAMAKALSLDVVAEGTETAVQVNELRALGCELAQGYLFSPAVSLTEITAMLLDGDARLRRTAI